MTEPCVWQLIGADIQSPGYCQQWSNRQIQCPDCITTTGRTCNRINDRRCTIKHMSKPCVWKLIGTNIQCSCYCQQRCNRQIQCSDCITTAGRTSDCICNSSGTREHMTEPGVWELVGTNSKISCNS